MDTEKDVVLLVSVHIRRYTIFYGHIRQLFDKYPALIPSTLILGPVTSKTRAQLKTECVRLFHIFP